MKESRRRMAAVVAGVVMAVGMAPGGPRAAALSVVPPQQRPHPDVRRLPEVPPEVPPGEAPGDVPPLVPPAEGPPVFEVPDVDRVLSEPLEPPSKPKRLWSGGVELGVDGTHGNTETMDVLLGVEAKRKTERNILALDLDYTKKSSHGRETAHESFLDWKYERLFQCSPWTAVAHGTVEYDEFQSFDVRTTLDLALGYQFVDTEQTLLSARAGSGAAYEYGGPGEGWAPEAVFGLEFEHRLNERHKITASSEYKPEMTAWNDFRVKTRLSWEALIDAEMNLSMKVSARNRYDSTPHGRDPNDVDYSVVLLWKF